MTNLKSHNMHLIKKLTYTNGKKWNEKYKEYTKRFSKLLALVNTTNEATMEKGNKFNFGIPVPDKFGDVTYWIRKMGLHGGLMPLLRS